jgi:hypothetical protein
MVAAIAMLMRRTDVDWTAVRHVAQASHAWNACAAGLRLASELLGVEVPPALAGTPWPAATVTLCAQALEALSQPPGVFGDRWAERRAHRAAFDVRADRLRYDVWRALAPTPLEWQWCPLPGALRWLYVPVRVVRLTSAAVRGALTTADAPGR